MPRIIDCEPDLSLRVFDGTHPDRSLYDENGKVRLRGIREDCEICVEQGVASPNKADYLVKMEDAVHSMMFYYIGYRCASHKDEMSAEDTESCEEQGMVLRVGKVWQWDGSKEQYVE